MERAYTSRDSTFMESGCFQFIIAPVILVLVVGVTFGPIAIIVTEPDHALPVLLITGGVILVLMVAAYLLVTFCLGKKQAVHDQKTWVAQEPKEDLRGAAKLDASGGQPFTAGPPPLKSEPAVNASDKSKAGGPLPGAVASENAAGDAPDAKETKDAEPASALPVPIDSASQQQKLEAPAVQFKPLSPELQIDRESQKDQGEVIIPIAAPPQEPPTADPVPRSQTSEMELMMDRVEAEAEAEAVSGEPSGVIRATTEVYMHSVLEEVDPEAAKEAAESEAKGRALREAELAQRKSAVDVLVKALSSEQEAELVAAIAEGTRVGEGDTAFQASVSQFATDRRHEELNEELRKARESLNSRLEEAKQLLERLRQRDAASKQMQAALDSRSTDGIREALEAARSAGLAEESELIVRARAFLKEADALGAAINDLQAAKKAVTVLDRTSHERLRNAMSEVEAAKGSSDSVDQELESAGKLLADHESRLAAVEAARTALASAKEEAQMEPLRNAIEAARTAGVPDVELEPAQKSLEDLEKKEKEAKAALLELEAAQLSSETERLRQAIAAASASQLEPQMIKRATVCLDSMAELETAEAAGEIEDLRKCIEAATSAGVNPNVLARANATLKDRLAEEEEKDAVLTELQSAALAREPSRIRKSLAQARSMSGIDEAAVQDAEKVLADLNSAIADASAELAAAEESKDPERIRQALQAATAACVKSESLAAAEKALAAAEARVAARQHLTAAAQGSDPAQLRAALDAAREADVNPTLIAESESALEALEKRIALAAEATADLEKAMKEVSEKAHPDPQARLLSAIAAAQAAEGVSAELLATASDALVRESRRIEATTNLAAAREAGNLAELRAALEAAIAAEVEPAAVEQAQEQVRVEEAKEAARSQLQAAVEANTFEALQAAMSRAEEVGIASEDAFEIAKGLLRALEAQAQAIERLKVGFAAGSEIAAGNHEDVEKMEEARDELVEALKVARGLGLGDAVKEVADAARIRRKLHNTLQDLKGATRVFCRVRPLNRRERDMDDKKVVFPQAGMSVDVTDPEKGDDPERFEFDAAFDETSSQEQIFAECKDLVQSVLDGYNITIFAYGQTGAGKTFTMMGAEDPPELKGVCPRTVEAVFEAIEKQMRFNCTVQAHMMEVYCSKINDLIAEARGSGSSSNNRPGSKASRNNEIKVHFHRGAVHLENIMEVEVQSAAELLQLLEDGNEAKQVCATAMNPGSSRSHTILGITINCVNKDTGHAHRGKILLVDLAGCERLKKSQVEGEAKREAIEINKSLTCLGDVISAVTLGKRVPYRNHILTKVMQDSLGGTAKTLMFVNVSPAEDNVHETITALRFACRAKTITREAQAATRLQAAFHGHEDRELVRRITSERMIEKTISEAAIAAG